MKDKTSIFKHSGAGTGFYRGLDRLWPGLSAGRWIQLRRGLLSAGEAVVYLYDDCEFCDDGHPRGVGLRICAAGNPAVYQG